jgi:sugar/nucleoside kinase (ribokinase family)
VNYEIIGIGGPILDQLVRVTDAYLESLPGEKGGMEPISYEQLEKIVTGSGSESIFVPGGSTRNTLHGLARFGEKCALVGMIGKDQRGETYRDLLSQQGIFPLLIESKTPTAIVLSLVTPDGERTMRTFQGASVEIRGHHLDPRLFEGVKLVHLEGYTLYNGDLPETAMRLARKAGAKVSCDLASFEIVKAFRDHILYLLDRYVDLIFCNEEEAKALLGLDEEAACDKLAEICEVAVVLMGQKGCWVRKGSHKAHCPAYPVEPLDTTGAGDLFSSGFLHGYMRYYPMDICAHYGAIAGRAVVQVMGPVIPHDAWEEIYQKLKQEL